MKRLAVLLLCGLSSLSSSVYAEQPAPQTETAAVAAFEFWNARDPNGHGWVIAHTQRRFERALLSLHYNTETLRLAADELELTGRHVWGAQIAGEYGFAGLLPDYYQDGQLIADRGFGASWVMAQVHAKFFAGTHHTFQPLLAVRQWFFNVSSDELVAPPETAVIETTLRYIYWNMDDLDPGIDVHRPQLRRSGLFLMLEGSAHTRTETRPWGALSPTSGEPDPRNNPDPTILRFRAIAEAAAELSDTVRLRWNLRGGYGVGEDDLSRDRIGGMNPFVVPVAGAPWAGWLSETYAGAEWAAMVALDAHEVGPFMNAVVVQDPGRLGTEEWGGLFGGGVHADLRFGAWQVDVRTGVSPTVGGEVGVSGLFSVGKTFGQ